MTFVLCPPKGVQVLLFKTSNSNACIFKELMTNGVSRWPKTELRIVNFRWPLIPRKCFVLVIASKY